MNVFRFRHSLSFVAAARLSLAALAFSLIGHLGMGAESSGHGDPKKTIVMLIAEPQYQTIKTLPAFADKFLRPEFNVEVISGSTADGEVAFDNIDAIKRADVLLVSVRRRTPPQAQMDAIRAYVTAGKPVVGIRTASHAFKLLKGNVPTGDADWPDWDGEVLGGSYIGHHPSGPVATYTAASPDEPLLRGVTLPLTSKGQLYRPSPLKAGAKPVLIGTIPDQKPEPAAWTFRRADGGSTFYTSLGAPEDFENPSFQRLLLNGIRWAADVTRAR